MERKKRVLHLIQSLGNGGCENMLLRTLPLLTDSFEHRIVTLREPGELAPRFAEKGLPVTTVRLEGLFDVAGYRRLLDEVRRSAPDVTVTYLFHADMIGRLFLQGRISGPVIPFLRTTYNHPRYLGARLLEQATKSLVPRYLANSDAVKDFYTSNIGVPAKKITVIPNGIDADCFDRIVPDPKLRESLGITPEDFVIVCVANLHPNKGHHYLLEAFEQLFRDHKNIRLLVVGDGTERGNLERQTTGYQSKGSVLFLGRRNDVPRLLKISDCFVLPTLFEGQSNAILEAMACGLPVITTDIPENRVLIQGGVSGILVRPKSSDKLSDAIGSLADDTRLRHTIGRTARTVITERFDIRATAKRLLDFFIDSTKTL